MALPYICDRIDARRSVPAISSLGGSWSDNLCGLTLMSRSTEQRPRLLCAGTMTLNFILCGREGRMITELGQEGWRGTGRGWKGLGGGRCSGGQSLVGLD